MNIKKENEHYKVESMSKKGTFYTVDAIKKTCSCPGYLFYARRKGDVCKHVKAVFEYIANLEYNTKDVAKKDASPIKNKKNSDGKKTKKEKEITEEDILNYIRKNNEVDAIELIEKYNEEILNRMIRQGTLIEIKGKIKII
ncbi:SWIM zinc finger family protein [Candidatus Woesearchaeota archaeon]|nr:SWIM zinc finger family protein [Candidatus Woesearchaeota archaeon]